MHCMCFQTSSTYLVRNLSVWEISFLLTNFQKLFTVSNTVTDVAPIFSKRCYACSTVVTITYYRDGQLILLKGHFEKVAFTW